MSIREHLAALQRAQSAGDEEAAEFIRNTMVAEQEAADRAAYDPARGQGAGQLFKEGVGRGAMNIGRNVGNILGVVSDERMAEAARQDAPLVATTPGKVGSFLGETATVALPTFGVAGLAGRSAGLIGKVAANPIGRGVIEGATQGAITAGPEHRMEGGVIGAATGAVLPAAGAAWRAARSGVRPTAAAQRLMNEGVQLTPGQMHPQGALNQLEEVAQAVPVAGKWFSRARERGYHQFQARVAQEVAPPGMTVKPSGDIHRIVDDIATGYDNAYTVAKGFPVRPIFLNTNGPNVPLLKMFENSAKAASTRASPEESKVMAKFLRDEIGRVKGGITKSDNLLEIRSNIRRAMREELPSSAKFRILKLAEKDVTRTLESQLPSGPMKALRATDTQYAKFKIFEDAVARAKDQTGSFTPAQLSQAVRQATRTSEYAKGGGLLRERAQDAVDIFQAKQPLTGRQVVTAGPVIAAAAQNPVTVGVPLGLGTAFLYGTPYGNALAAGRTGLQQGMRAFERETRRKVPKLAREAAAFYGRNALVNAATGP